MKKPDMPPDEEARLKALRSLDILDTPPEERFDRLTRLAKRVFGVPIALVSLVDSDRQWFKSRVGLEATETSRDVSFCGHAILGDDVFAVEDASSDGRFSDNPLVTGDPNIRFYAGCPLSHADGSKLGTLCIIDTAPRTLNDDDVVTLKDLAELAERELAAVALATVDELTGLSNRRGFTRLAQISLDLCARQSRPASLVFFDLNRFKPINDQFGHAEGDYALRVFADNLKNIFRSSDVLGRIGGDEFVALLADADEELAQTTVERLHTSVDDHNASSNRGYEILFSAGVVTKQPDESIEEMLKRADSLMYSMKSKSDSR